MDIHLSQAKHVCRPDPVLSCSCRITGLAVWGGPVPGGGIVRQGLGVGVGMTGVWVLNRRWIRVASGSFYLQGQNPVAVRTRGNAYSVSPLMSCLKAGEPTYSS